MAQPKLYTASFTALNQALTIDVTDSFRDESPVAVIADITGTWAGTFVGECSVDGVTWRTAQGYDPGSPNYSVISSKTSTGLVVYPLYARYFRIRCSAYTSGTFVVNANTCYTDGLPWTSPPNSAVIIGAVNANTGTTITRLLAAATTNGALVKGSAGNLVSVVATNFAAYDVFVKFYNKSTAPTVGTDAVQYTIRVPAGGTVIWETQVSKRFSAGIGIAITKLGPDADATALIAGDCTVTYEYI
jgi:hypothetical protein